jgi:hypothetical protein
MDKDLGTPNTKMSQNIRLIMCEGKYAYLLLSLYRLIADGNVILKRNAELYRMRVTDLIPCLAI